MKSGVYRIINVVNGHTYIGSAVHLIYRMNNHLALLSKNSHHNRYLQNAFNLYRRDSFTFDVLEYCEKDELIKREQFWMDAYKTQGIILYNICPVAGNTAGRYHSEETKRKMSEAQKGKTVTEEARRKSSITQKGRLIREEVKKKMSEAHRGKSHSEETKQKISIANQGVSRGKGTTRTQKTKNRISIAKKKWWAGKRSANK